MIDEGMAEVVTDAERIRRFVGLSNAKYDVDYGLDFYDPAVNATVRLRHVPPSPSWRPTVRRSPTRWTFAVG